MNDPIDQENGDCRRKATSLQVCVCVGVCLFYVNRINPHGEIHSWDLTRPMLGASGSGLPASQGGAREPPPGVGPFPRLWAGRECVNVHDFVLREETVAPNVKTKLKTGLTYKFQTEKARPKKQTVHVLGGVEVGG